MFDFIKSKILKIRTHRKTVERFGESCLKIGENAIGVSLLVMLTSKYTEVSEYGGLVVFMIGCLLIVFGLSILEDNREK